MFKMLLLSMAVASSGAGAGVDSNSTAYPWWCGVTAELEGDPQHFFVNGRDAWTKRTKMTCYSTEKEITQEVVITFNSYNRGYGAGHDSVLRLGLTVWTKSIPIRFRQLISGLVNNSLVHWNHNSGDIDLTATVWTSNQFNAAQSLTLGTLTIEPLGN